MIISINQFLFCCFIIEFQPGVPWKGIQTGGDPESDPYITPGSVLGSPGPPTLNDSDHQLLRDNIGIKENVENLLSWHFTVSLTNFKKV